MIEPSHSLPEIVVKVGGSLFDRPDLGPMLQRWLERRGGRCLLVPGGGPMADVVRSYHRTHRLPEVDSHWLAIRAMSINANLLETIVGGGAVVVDALAFCQLDEDRPGSLPHTWRVTSDAIAARIAEVRGAKLVLLKSVELPAGISWSEAAERGLVDSFFGEVVERAALEVEWVNFRG